MTLQGLKGQQQKCKDHMHTSLVSVDTVGMD